MVARSKLGETGSIPMLVLCALKRSGVCDGTAFATPINSTTPSCASSTSESAGCFCSHDDHGIPSIPSCGCFCSHDDHGIPSNLSHATACSVRGSRCCAVDTVPNCSPLSTEGEVEKITLAATLGFNRLGCMPEQRSENSLSILSFFISTQ